MDLIKGFGVQPTILRRAIVLIFFAAWLSVFGADEILARQAKRVVVLHSYHKGFIWTDNIMEGIRSVFDKADLDVELFVEYMDVKRHKKENVFPLLEQLYMQKLYADCDAIIISDNSALDFILARRNQLFPNVPIIFCGINEYSDSMFKEHEGITGVVADIDLAATIDMALQLHPKTKRIAVISDSTDSGWVNLIRLREIKYKFEHAAKFIELADLTAEELQVVLRQLPEDTIILFLSFSLDRAGEQFSQNQGVDLVAANSNLPIYSFWDFFIQYGALGGVVMSGRMQGEYAARMTVRILNGEPAGSIPVLLESSNVPMFNYSQLKRFGFSNSSLSEGSIILNEPRSFYYHNKKITWTVVAVIIGLTVLLVLFWMLFVQRKKAQEKESDLLQQLKSIFRHLPVGIAYLNAEYKYIGANRFFCDFSGYQEEELIGRACYDMIGEYAGDTEKEGLERVCSFCKKEDCFRDKRLAVFYRTLEDAYFKVTIIPELDKTGNVYRVMEVFEDITDRKLAEKALLESEKNFRELVASSLAGILITQDDQIIYKNPEQESLFGPIPERFSLLDFVGIHPDDAEKVRHAYKRIVAGESRVMDMDFRFYPPGKMNSKPDMRWVYCRARLIEYQGKDAIIISMMDMTRAKELEHLLRMEDKMTSLGHVAAGIAHEIRNPLSGINIYLSALEKIYKREESKEKVKAIIAQLQSASNKIESVIRRVMDFSKPCEPRFILLDINKPINTALELCTVTLKKADMVIHKHLAENPPSCYIDPNLMEQVILNLITNASEAMRDREGKKIIEVASSVKDDRIVVKVADSGPGVPEGLKDRVFEPFYTTKYDGTGIGLSLSHRIIKDHNGSFDVSTSRYNGAEFVIEIPLERRKRPRKKTDRSENSPFTDNDALLKRT